MESKHCPGGSDSESASDEASSHRASPSHDGVEPARLSSPLAESSESSVSEPQAEG